MREGKQIITSGDIGPTNRWTGARGRVSQLDRLN